MPGAVAHSRPSWYLYVQFTIIFKGFFVALAKIKLFSSFVCKQMCPKFATLEFV